MKERKLKGRHGFYGFIYRLEDTGQRIYVPYRYQKHFHRNGHPTMTEAEAKGELGWAIDVDTISELKAEGIDVIVFYVQDTRELFLTYREWFWAHPSSGHWSYSHRGGSDQRRLFLDAFIPHKMAAKKRRGRSTILKQPVSRSL